jgi:hypothetical protein
MLDQLRHAMIGEATPQSAAPESRGSPYALKLRSLMRYQRLAFDRVPASPA